MHINSILLLSVGLYKVNTLPADLSSELMVSKGFVVITKLSKPELKKGIGKSSGFTSRDRWSLHQAYSQMLLKSRSRFQIQCGDKDCKPLEIKPQRCEQATMRRFHCKLPLDNLRIEWNFPELFKEEVTHDVVNREAIKMSVVKPIGSHKPDSAFKYHDHEFKCILIMRACSGDVRSL